MNRRCVIAVALMVIAGVSCTTATPPPPGAPSQGQNASTSSAPVPTTITGSQRLQHAWTKAMEGLAMGGTIGGPYGAGGGLVIGLIAGLFMADSHYTALNSQIVAEQQKDRQLEAALEQELARQRELETQIAGATATTTPAAPDQPGATAGAAGDQQQTVQPREPAPAQRSNEQLASLSKPTPAPQAPPLFKNVEVKDINGDGVPDLWLYHNPQKPGEIIR